MKGLPQYLAAVIFAPAVIAGVGFAVVELQRLSARAQLARRYKDHDHESNSN